MESVLGCLHFSFILSFLLQESFVKYQTVSLYVCKDILLFAPLRPSSSGGTRGPVRPAATTAFLQGTLVERRRGHHRAGHTLNSDAAS